MSMNLIKLIIILFFLQDLCTGLPVTQQTQISGPKEAQSRPVFHGQQPRRWKCWRHEHIWNECEWTGFFCRLPSQRRKFQISFSVAHILGRLWLIFKKDFAKNYLERLEFGGFLGSLLLTAQLCELNMNIVVCGFVELSKLWTMGINLTLNS